MFRNYFKIAFRNLKRNKSYAIINIAGLAIGIGACLLIFLVLQFQLGYDSHHADKERIYRMVLKDLGEDGVSYSSAIALPVPEGVRKELPQVEYVSGIVQNTGAQVLVKEGNDQKKFRQDVFFVEKDLFNILSFKWLSGDAKAALNDPGNAVICRSVADKMFGSWKNAIGKTFKYQNRTDYKIAGVFEDAPAATDVNIQMALPFRDASGAGGFTDWISISSSTNVYVKLRSHVDPAAVDKQLSAFTRSHMPADSKREYFLQPLKEVHFDDRFGNYSGSVFSSGMRLAIVLIGVFLLITACVNFINLATAQAVNRSREIGVRKALGSTRKQLVLQFMNEMLFITCTAVVLAVGLAFVFVPFVNDLLALRMSIGLANLPGIVLFLLGITATVTLLSGFYPAVVLSGFNPVAALKNRITTRSVGGLSLRRGLVIFQFVIAQALIIGTLVILQQMNYFRNTSMGYDKEMVVNVPIPPDSVSRSKVEILKQQLLENPGISMIAASAEPPSDYGHWWSGFYYDHQAEETKFATTIKWADEEFAKLYGITFVAGGNYSAKSDTVREFIVNEELVRKLGIKDPHEIIGKNINLWNRMSAPVVGVMKDFHSSSLHSHIDPVLMSTATRRYATLNIRIVPSKITSAMADIEKKWNAAYPDFTYEHRFLDDVVASFYEQEARLSRLYEVFAGIAIFISCLGLYGLVAFMAAQRKKEMGIRKVLGASVANIIYLFSREFTILTGIAFLIAAPLAGYFMQRWLENFVFGIHLSAGIFLTAIGASLLLALLTVGGRAFSTATADPVKSLKAE